MLESEQKKKKKSLIFGARRLVPLSGWLARETIRYYGLSGSMACRGRGTKEHRVVG